jgi:hypothetical protein
MKRAQRNSLKADYYMTSRGVINRTGTKARRWIRLYGTYSSHFSIFTADFPKIHLSVIVPPYFQPPKCQFRETFPAIILHAVFFYQS